MASESAEQQCRESVNVRSHGFFEDSEAVARLNFKSGRSRAIQPRSNSSETNVVLHQMAGFFQLLMTIYFCIIDMVLHRQSIQRADDGSVVGHLHQRPVY